MNKRKRWLACLLCAAMMAGVFSGCNSNEPAPSSSPTPAPTQAADNDTPKETDAADGQDETPAADEVENMNLEGFPIAKEPITLKITNMQTPIQDDFNNMVILKNFEEKSNVKVEWTNIPQEFVPERRNIIMASGDLPDIFFKMNFPATDVSKYSQQGQFIPLSDLIDKYAPNVQKAFETWPDVKMGLTMADGNIYSLSYILGAPAITAGGKMFFNQKALDGVGKEIPTTTEELREVLTLFKDFDLNGNGEKDEIPFSTSTMDNLDLLFRGSFGLNTVGSGHSYVDLDLETRELRLMQMTDNYKQELQYLNSLFAEGLIDPEIVMMDMPKLIAKGEQGRLPSYSFVNHSIIGTTYGNDSVGMIAPFKGPNGDQLWGNQGSALSGAGNFMITSTNKYPEISMRWGDYWYSDDGVREYFMGVEDETYYVDENGEYQYTDFVMNNPDGIMFEQVLGKYVPWAGGANPSIASNEYFKGGEMQPITKASADKLIEYGPEQVWPAFLWAEDEADDMASLTTDIKTYVEEKRAQFITGQLNFESDWDTYIKGFEALGVSRYLEIYKNAMQRYGL